MKIFGIILCALAFAYTLHANEDKVAEWAKKLRIKEMKALDNQRMYGAFKEKS